MICKHILLITFLNKPRFILYYPQLNDIKSRCVSQIVQLNIVICLHTFNDKTVLFQTTQFNISNFGTVFMSSTSICNIDRTLSGATTPGQNGPGCNDNEVLLFIPQRFYTGTSPSGYFFFVISRKLVGRILSLCKDAVGVFSNTSRLGTTWKIVVCHNIITSFLYILYHGELRRLFDSKNMKYKYQNRFVIKFWNFMSSFVILLIMLIENPFFIYYTNIVMF